MRINRRTVYTWCGSRLWGWFGEVSFDSDSDINTRGDQKAWIRTPKCGHGDEKESATVSSDSEMRQSGAASRSPGGCHSREVTVI